MTDKGKDNKEDKLNTKRSEEERSSEGFTMPSFAELENLNAQYKQISDKKKEIKESQSALKIDEKLNNELVYNWKNLELNDPEKIYFYNKAKQSILENVNRRLRDEFSPSVTMDNERVQRIIKVEVEDLAFDYYRQANSPDAKASHKSTPIPNNNNNNHLKIETEARRHSTGNSITPKQEKLQSNKTMIISSPTILKKSKSDEIKTEHNEKDKKDKKSVASKKKRRWSTKK